MYGCYRFLVKQQVPSHSQLKAFQGHQQAAQKGPLAPPIPLRSGSPTQYSSPKSSSIKPPRLVSAKSSSILQPRSLPLHTSKSTPTLPSLSKSSSHKQIPQPSPKKYSHLPSPKTNGGSSVLANGVATFKEPGEPPPLPPHHYIRGGEAKSHSYEELEPTLPSPQKQPFYEILERFESTSSNSGCQQQHCYDTLDPHGSPSNAKSHDYHILESQSSLASSYGDKRTAIYYTKVNKKV